MTIERGTVRGNMDLLFVGEAIALVCAVVNRLGWSVEIISMASMAGLFLMVMGLKGLRKVHPGYARAFRCILLGVAAAMTLLILTVALLVVSFGAEESREAEVWVVFLGVMMGLVSAVCAVLNFLAVRNVCMAATELMTEAGDSAAAGLSAPVVRVYLAATVMSVVILVLPFIPGIRDLRILQSLTGAVSLLAIGLYLYFLYRAKTRLS